jgi:predicted small metal-binding protein
MAKVINCDCGYVARGETDEDLLADVRKHIADQHPDDPGRMEVSDEDLLSQAVEA